MFLINSKLKQAEQTILGNNIHLRMARKSDYDEWYDVRNKNFEFLQPYEPTWSKDCLSKKHFFTRLRSDRHGASIDAKYAYLIFSNSNNALIGGININNVHRGVFQACSLGYWMAKEVNSKGFMSEAVNLLTNRCLTQMGFNRVQAATLVHNQASIRVLEKNGFDKEGIGKSFLKINGQWQDHILFAKIAK